MLHKEEMDPAKSSSYSASPPRESSPPPTPPHLGFPLGKSLGWWKGGPGCADCRSDILLALDTYVRSFGISSDSHNESSLYKCICFPRKRSKAVLLLESEKTTASGARSGFAHKLLRWLCPYLQEERTRVHWELCACQTHSLPLLLHVCS